MAAAAILNFKKFQFLVTCLSSGSLSDAVYRVSSKSDNFSLRLWRFNDFQNGGRPPSWILKICSFCHVARIDMPFCFLVQNLAEIGQSIDELWPKKRFSRWRPPPSGILKISIFGHVTVIGFNIWCSVPNSSKSDDFSLRCGDLTIFKMVADRHLGFKKFAVFVMQPISTFDMPFCFLVQNFAEIGQSIDKLWPKKRFEDGRRRHLEF